MFDQKKGFLLLNSTAGRGVKVFAFGAVDWDFIPSLAKPCNDFKIGNHSFLA